MNDKAVRIDAGLGTGIHNDYNKRLQNGNVTYTNKDKSYSDSSHSSGKTDTRPCAIIGPDRVVPSTDSNDMYMKTIPVEPWEYLDNYRHPYDTIKMSEYHQAHNISPRQTFQENMQRIMVPPTYSSIKSSDETSLKNPKLNVPSEGKYCDVPYSINTLNSEPKSVQSDSAMSAINSSFPRGPTPHGWHGGGMQSLKPYPAHDFYHNTEYSNCPAPRPMPMIQTQRIVHDETLPMYTDRLYQESNIRFKPYPTSKEKFPQPRYEYANTFQPPQNPIPKFDIQKSHHSHNYPIYPQGPYKYTVDRRYPEPMMESHQRVSYPQHNTFRTHPIHPSYTPLPGNFYHTKPYPSPSDNPKSGQTNKLSYDANNKIYLELENSRYKGYPSPDQFYYNDRAKFMRGDILIPGHTQLNPMGQQHLYRKENLSIKNYDHFPHYPYRDHRNLGNPLARMPVQFSPNTVSISPCDSNTSNEALMLAIPQEDCGYVSQSSTTSVRSLDSNNSTADFYKRQGFNYMPIVHNASQRENNLKPSSSTDKKGLNVRQFLQMWNEGDEEETGSNNEVPITSKHVSPKTQVTNSQEQLYVLGSVTVPKEELSKYEHLQKVSKLPENIKGYNNIELLNQFEQLVESPSLNNFHVKNPPLKEYKLVPQTFSTNQIKEGIQRPVSPLDVEAKISQSVIHKEVGCNFEIKPCSPKVLNVDVAAPVHDVLGERFIEKVANPVLLSLENGTESKIEIVDKSMKVASCKMVNSAFNQNNANSAIVKPMYPLQDLNANMGVCLASLPQLDSDIDLNLPEVNQQFIDANKTRSSQPNVQLLENTHADNSFTKTNIYHQKNNDSSISYCELDNETTKLSKYRKTKKIDTPVNNPILPSSSVYSTQRTDSVIIKNPENTKVCNEDQNESLEMVNNLVHEMNQEVHQGNYEVDKNVLNSENNEMAIDFSVNRNDKDLNTESEIGKSTTTSTIESHFYESNKNLLEPESNKLLANKTNECNKKTKKFHESPNLILIQDSLAQKNDNRKVDTSDIRKHREKCNTNEKTQKLIAIKDTLLTETRFYDCQSKINTSPGWEIGERVQERKINVEHQKQNNKKEEKYQITEDVINNCANENILPDLSFELAAGLNGQPTSQTKCSTNQEDVNLGTVLTTNTDIKDTKCIKKNSIKNINTVKDSDISNIIATSDSTKQTFNDSDNTKIGVDTSTLVDTIEKELEDMDTKSDVTLNARSLEYKQDIKYSLTKNESCANDLFPHNIDETNNPSVSVITSSDSLRNIENEEEYNINSTNNIQECKSTTDFTAEKKILQSHNEATFSSILTSNTLNNEKVEKNPNLIESDDNNLEKKTQLLEETLINTEKRSDKVDNPVKKNCSSKKTEDKIDNKNNCDEVKGENNTIISSKISTEIATIDGFHNDYKLPMEKMNCKSIKEDLPSETGCNQKLQENTKIDGNQEDIAAFSLLQNMNKLTLEPEDDLDRSYIYKNKTFNTYNIAHYEKRVHRKALLSPWIQNLILYNTDSQMLCKNKIDTETNDLKSVVKKDSASEDIDIITNDSVQKSEIIEDLHGLYECKDVNENLSLDKIVESSEKLYEKICEVPTCSLALEDEQAHLFKHSFPLTLGNGTKLLKRTSKRSLSDSSFRSSIHNDESSTKRCKSNEIGFLESPGIDAKLSNIFRRNSISEIYNDGNVVILIDKDLILTEENQEQKFFFADEEVITNNYDNDREIIDTIAENLPQYEKELWVDDVACTETVFSDDVAEDVTIGTPSSPRDFMSSNYETVNNDSFMLCEEVIKNMENDVDVNEIDTFNDSKYSMHSSYQYHDSNVDDIFTCLVSPKDPEMFTSDKIESNRRKAEDILNHFETSTAFFSNLIPTNDIMQDDKENVEVLNSLIQETETDTAQPNSDDENYENYSCTLSTCNYSSSPEVTSTTCETPGIILKISNKRSKSSQLEDSKPVVNNKISYKLTEKKKYKPNFKSSGTLITKAAQKYIPPIKITISDLKVKLPLPKNSLDKLREMKTSKVEPKIDKKPIKTYSLSTQRENKKPKPKFEDVLMSIDKFQYKRTKIKNKKMRDQIPKMVIKKNESGAHYASCSSPSIEDTRNPDLTGRKWQPWVFIEKNSFIDKMALKHKVKAIYCRRKKTYVLAEKFRKYKSVYNAKFVITQPNTDDLNKGNLKYTIRLKHQ